MHIAQVIGVIHPTYVQVGYILNVQMDRRFRISETGGRISLKFGVWLATKYLSVLHKPRLGYICTFARAYPFPISREWLDGLRWNLVCGERPKGYEFKTDQGWGASAPAHVQNPFPYLGNTWTHCTEIWHVVMNQLALHFMHVTSVVISARAHTRASISYLGKNWTHHAEIWCVVRPINYAFYEALSGRYIKVWRCNETSLLKHTERFR